MNLTYDPSRAPAVGVRPRKYGYDLLDDGSHRCEFSCIACRVRSAHGWVQRGDGGWNLIEWTDRCRVCGHRAGGDRS